MPQRYDVAVIGAGPAGSATARDLARGGARVLLVEKHRQVGVPMFCSGFITPRTLDLAGVSHDLILWEARGARVHLENGRTLRLGGDRVYACAVDRVGLDQALAAQAEDAGAELRLRTRLVDLEREEGGLRLALRSGQASEAALARVVVGADGPFSTVARWMGVRNRDGYVHVAFAEGEAPGLGDEAHVFISPRVARGWFGWAIPTCGDRVRVGVGDIDAMGLPPRAALEQLRRAFPRQLEGVRPGRAQSMVIPLYAPTRSYGDNVVLVGDAARQAKATTGGGIYTALRAARHASAAVLAGLERGDVSAQALSAYERAWHADFAGELARGLELRRVFLDLNDAKLDRVLSLLNLPYLKRVAARFGDVDYQSPMFGHLVKAAPVFRWFTSLPIGVPLGWTREAPATHDALPPLPRRAGARAR